jgi:hypothetical protein
MKQLLKIAIQNLSYLITSFNNFLKKLENTLADDKLILIKTSQNTLGKK